MDEAHTSFLDDDYRTTMDSLRHLNRATCHKLAMTATLIPKHEGILADHVGISLAESLVLRSSSARPNHLIQVADVARPTQPSDVSLGLASLLLVGWEEDPHARGIIFVRSINKLKDLSAAAPFASWAYAGPMTEEERGRNMDGWLSDAHPGKWMFATTALLQGLDYPRVDAVIFMESPYGLYEFVQGSGRAGRSGQKSLIAIIHQSPLPEPFPTSLTAKEMYAVIQTTSCRRAAISLTMDGTAISCTELPSSVRCDMCEGRLDPLITQAIANADRSRLNPVVDPPIPTATASPSDVAYRCPPATTSRSLLKGKTAQGNAESRRESALESRDLISKYSGCFACRIVSLKHGPCHDSCGMTGLSTCSEAPHVPLSCTKLTHKTGWIQWKKAFAPSHDVKRCYFCWLPMNVLTGGLHKAELPSNVKCRYGDSAIVAAWHILNTPVLMDGVRRDLDFVSEDDLQGSFREWLAGYASETEDIRLFSVFAWLCKRFYL